MATSLNPPAAANPATAISRHAGRKCREVAGRDRSSMAWRMFRVTNPEGWQIVAGGRSTAETPGSGWAWFGILEGCQSSATPPGSIGDFGMRSGGIAALNPRLLSGKPPACSPARSKTNRAAPLDGGCPSGFAFLARWPAASEPRG